VAASQEQALEPRRAAELLERIEGNIHRVIVGKDRVVRLALAGLACGFQRCSQVSILWSAHPYFLNINKGTICIQLFFPYNVKNNLLVFCIVLLTFSGS